MNHGSESGSVARWWRAWTSLDSAEQFEQLLRETILPRLAAVDGFRGAYLLRREHAVEEVEFATMTIFDSVEAITSFAGEDAERAVLFPEAQARVTRFEERAQHFGIREHLS